MLSIILGGVLIGPAREELLVDRRVRFSKVARPYLTRRPAQTVLVSAVPSSSLDRGVLDFRILADDSSG